MVHICIHKNQKAQVIGFSATGHVEGSPAGENIVCAAVSAITQCTVLGIMERLKIKPNRFHIDEDGELELALPKSLNKNDMDNAQLLLDTMILGLRSIEMSEPGALCIEEVV